MNLSNRLSLEKLHNTRDLGGMVGKDGRRVKKGRLIRSGHLAVCSERDISDIAALADTIVDFRTAQEVEEKPDPVIAHVTRWHMPIFDSLKAGVTHEEESDEYALEVLARDSRKALRYMCGLYTNFVSGEFAVSQYAKFVRLLLEPHEKAVLWHCTAGKDRAGFASVIVEELLGVDRDAIRADYLKTNDYLAAEIEELTQWFRMYAGIDTSDGVRALQYLFGAREEFLDALYQKAAELYGDFDGFIAEGLRISEDERAAFRELYLEERR